MMMNPLYFGFLTILFCFVNSETFKVDQCVLSKHCRSHDFELFVEDPSPKPTEKITLSFAIKLRNVAELSKLVDQVSDPNSKQYGKYWSFDQVGKLCENGEAHSKVMKHLLKFVDAKQITSTKYLGFVRVKTDIQTAERILKTKYHNFKSSRSSEQVYRTLEFELPASISESIDWVYPTVQFPSNLKASLEPLMISEKKRDASTKTITPAVLKAFYNISSTVESSQATQSVYASLSQSFSPIDLQAFQIHFGLATDSVNQTIGKNSPKVCASNPGKCAEASLDLQYIMAIAQHSPTTFWSMPKMASVLEWIEAVSSTPNTPLVHSISYGTYEEGIPSSEQQRFSQEVAKLAAQGVTVVVASGDDGVSNSENPRSCGFHPTYPANIPYVLSVGATMGVESGLQSEIACQADKGSLITSGGGFSTIFPTPEYQSLLVSKYLSDASNSSLEHQAQSSMFNSNGRGYPDVAISGNQFEIVVNQRIAVVSGTSASAPVFAGIITLANNARFKQGKPALGFVNPLLYQLYQTTPSIFNDVISGNNRCSAVLRSGSPVCCEVGFNCLAGWDPVTGLGSVNVGLLIEALSGL